mgnify:FL=1
MIKIMSNLTTSTTKLLGTNGSNSMVQWRAGANQADIRKSCEDAQCAFLTGGVFIDPETGKTIAKEFVSDEAGTITKDPIYIHDDGRQLMKVDKCFSLFGTPMLSAYAVDIRYPERLGMSGLKKAISEAPRNSDRARGALVGNASTIVSEDEMKQIDEEIREAGMHHILYDHAWRVNRWILNYAVASCNHFKDVRDAIDMGATVCSVVLPQNIIDKVKGSKIGDHTLIQCPENISSKINCVNCGGKKGPLCEAQTRSNLVVMFHQHGALSWERSKNSTLRNIAKASEKLDETPKGKAKIAHKIKVKATLSELEKAIKTGNRDSIVSIGKRAIANVSSSTAKRYHKFLEIVK